MGKLAIVFSGQGAQYPGMGKSLYDNSCIAKKLYDEAEKFRPGTLEQSFVDAEGKLNHTKNTQPCLYLVDLCAALALRECGIEADGVAGFSLGEIAALAYAGAYTPEKGFEIVTNRGLFMQKAAEKCDTAMAAVLKLNCETVEDICKQIDDIYPVNYNSPVQTVIAGSKTALKRFKEKAKNYSARVIDLAVSAAFHSPYMNEAADEFAKYIGNVSFDAPKIPVYSNYNALPYGSDVYSILSKQMNNSVRWKDTIDKMISDGYTDFIEAGAGKTLCGLIKKISTDVSVYSVEDIESLKKTVEAVKNYA